MKNKKRYKNNKSAQTARQIARNRARNKPRLKRLKECMGCQACGRCNIDGDLLDGHHYNGKRFKYKPLAHLLNRSWRRIIREIQGLDRDAEHGGGPVVFWCQRYHEDYEQFGENAITCKDMLKHRIEQPERLPNGRKGNIHSK